ncbi:MAG: nucleotidyltransferase domain-containing protein [Candidatus Omnitrophica bacterium]|nr:nucleotidyltransferase domain-containing protein [Candidatus Omnitrophota bacterium]
MLDGIIYNTTTQKVLAFLLKHPDEKYYDREVSRLSKISKAAVNIALRNLLKTGLVLREKKGRMYFYHVDPRNSFIKQLKITQNIIILKPLVDKLCGISIKIVLYGSASLGQNNIDSDIDLFVLTREPEKVQKIIYKSHLRAKIQYVINTPQNLAKLKKENSVFHKKITKGILLFEEK